MFHLHKESHYIEKKRNENPYLFQPLHIGKLKKNVLGPTYVMNNENITGWAMNMESMLFNMNASKQQVEFAKNLAKIDIKLYNEYVLKSLDVYDKWKDDIDILLKLEKEINLSVKELEREEKRIVHLRHHSKKYKSHIDTIKKIFHGIVEEIEKEDDYQKVYITRFIKLVKQTEHHRDEFEKKMKLLRENFPFLFVNGNFFNHNGFHNHYK